MAKHFSQDDLKAWAKRHNYKEDRFHHFQKTLHEGTTDEKTYRLKIGSASVRKEIKHRTGWIRLRSAYYKDLKLDATDHLVWPKGALLGAGAVKAALSPAPETLPPTQPAA